MKALKFILIGVIVVVILVAVAALIAPTKTTVSRSLQIDANPKIILEHVKNLKKANTWSPWNDYDPNLEVSFEGEQGEVGSKSFWKGNDEVGEGYQMLTSYTPERVDIKLVFTAPWEAENAAFFDINPNEKGAMVTWGFEGETPYPMNIMNLFYDLDEMIGDDYMRGLQNLKSITERIDFLSMGYFVEETAFDEKAFLTIRKTIPMSEIADFFSPKFEALYTKAGLAGATVEPAPYGLFYEWDEENGKTDLAAALAVVEGVDNFDEELPAYGGKALKIEYWGGYAASYDAHIGLGNYMLEMGYNFNDLVIEHYLTNPEEEPDSTQWHTDIYYLVN